MCESDILQSWTNCKRELEAAHARIAELEAKILQLESQCFPDELPQELNKAQAAKFLNRSPGFFRNHPEIPKIKEGYRTVYYRREDLQRFLDTHKPRKGASHESRSTAAN